MNNELTATLATIEKCREITNCPDGVDLQDWVKQLAAENVGLKEDRDTLARYWIEDGGDKDCAMSYCEPTPATDRIVAGIKADAITASLDACSDYLDKDCVMDRLDISYEDAEKRTSGAIEFHDAMVDFANQVREGAK